MVKLFITTFLMVASRKFALSFTGTLPASSASLSAQLLLQEIGNVVTPDRAPLDPKRVEGLVMASSNWNLVTSSLPFSDRFKMTMEEADLESLEERGMGGSQVGGPRR